uniref:Uncharacterized protein n=1 Tax=Vitis vinifera TaxID=29760 RepID=A5BE64_VITVI|nr:hypothetical protein VITISV_019817 [Vitis vinifera]
MDMQTVTLATFHLLRISHIRNYGRLTFHILRISHIRNYGRVTFHILQISHIQNSGRVTFHILRISHIRNSGRVTFHILRIFHIRRLTPDGKGGRFNFLGQTYPDPLIALTRRILQPFCTVPRCSPEASRYLRPTF